MRIKSIQQIVAPDFVIRLNCYRQGHELEIGKRNGYVP